MAIKNSYILPQDRIEFTHDNIDSLIEQGADIKRLGSNWGETPLLYALSNLGKKEIEKYLPLFDPNIPDYRGHSALAVSIANPALWEHIPALLSYGAKTDNEDYQTFYRHGSSITPIEDMIIQYEHRNKNSLAYTNALVALLCATDQKKYCRENAQGLLTIFLHKCQNTNSALFEQFIQNYDFTAQTKTKDNAIHKLLNSYYFETELYELIFKTHKAQLPHILTQKNTDKETALHTYLDIFLNPDETQDEALPESLFLFFKEYLNIFYKTPKDEKKWQQFIEAPIYNGLSIKDYIANSLEQERFQIMVEQHVLNLKIKPNLKKLNAADKKSFKI